MRAERSAKGEMNSELSNFIARLQRFFERVSFSRGAALRACPWLQHFRTFGAS